MATKCEVLRGASVLSLDWVDADFGGNLGVGYMLGAVKILMSTRIFDLTPLRARRHEPS